jgi:hypothetical protein
MIIYAVYTYRLRQYVNIFVMHVYKLNILLFSSQVPALQRQTTLGLLLWTSCIAIQRTLVLTLAEQRIFLERQLLQQIL